MLFLAAFAPAEVTGSKNALIVASKNECSACLRCMAAVKNMQKQKMQPGAAISECRLRKNKKSKKKLLF